MNLFRAWRQFFAKSDAAENRVDQAPSAGYEEIRKIKKNPNFNIFASFLKQNYETINFRELTHEHITQFSAYLKHKESLEKRELSDRTRGEYAYAIRSFIKKNYPGSNAAKMVQENEILKAWMQGKVDARKKSYVFTKEHPNAAIFAKDPPNENVGIFLKFLDKKYDKKFDLASIEEKDIQDFHAYLQRKGEKAPKQVIMRRCVLSLRDYMGKHFPRSTGTAHIVKSEVLDALRDGGVRKCLSRNDEKTEESGEKHSIDEERSEEPARERSDNLPAAPEKRASRYKKIFKKFSYNSQYDKLFPIRDPLNPAMVHSDFSKDGKTCGKITVGNIDFGSCEKELSLMADKEKWKKQDLLKSLEKAIRTELEDLARNKNPPSSKATFVRRLKDGDLLRHEKPLLKQYGLFFSERKRDFPSVNNGKIACLFHGSYVPKEQCREHEEVINEERCRDYRMEAGPYTLYPYRGGNRGQFVNTALRDPLHEETVVKQGDGKQEIFERLGEKCGKNIHSYTLRFLEDGAYSLTPQTRNGAVLNSVRSDDATLFNDSMRKDIHQQFKPAAYDDDRINAHVAVADVTLTCYGKTQVWPIAFLAVGRIDDKELLPDEELAGKQIFMHYGEEHLPAFNAMLRDGLQALWKKARSCDGRSSKRSARGAFSESGEREGRFKRRRLAGEERPASKGVPHRFKPDEVVVPGAVHPYATRSGANSAR